MTTYQNLLMRSGTLELIEEALEKHSECAVADRAEKDKKTIAQIKDALKKLHEEQ